ncbi:MAG: methyltransferase domain-containing protein [Bryobacterales bacterium]|nr:methyltransferase domain-containing protein [Bryobacterales bacterium]
METVQTVTDQKKLWNGSGGRGWVEVQEVVDTMFRPFEELLVKEAAARGAQRVLDIGCGTGGTTVGLQRALGHGAGCVGIDVSGPMIEGARKRAEREGVAAQFVQADAQSYGFETGSFDMLVSRFGVMFFDDFVEAFANLRRATKPGGEMRFIAWRSPAENPFMTTAERAAAPLLPGIPPRRTDAPGQFAFSYRERVQGILEESGWEEIAIEPLDVVCTLAVSDLDLYLGKIGPLSMALQEADEATRAHVLGVVREAFAPYIDGEQVRYTAACWLLRARVPQTPTV